MIQKITSNIAQTYYKNLSQKTFGRNFLIKFWENLLFNYDISIFV